MKRKKLLLFFGLIVVSLSAYAYSEIVLRGERVQLSVYYEDPELTGNMPQNLVQIPTVSIEGDCLYFYDVFSVTVPLVVVDSNNNVVFSAYLYSGEDKKLLPDSLISGTYTLYMRVGTTTYYGTFNL